MPESVQPNCLKLNSISLDSFAQEDIQLGKNVHLHDGIWWIQTAPLYCKPLHEFQRLRWKQKRPKFRASILGYSHQLDGQHVPTRTLSWNFVQGERLSKFSLNSLSQRKRNQVRNSLSKCDVRNIVDIEPWLSQIKKINIAQARRFDSTSDKKTYLPPSYYDKFEDKWRSDMRRLFAHRGHHFIGAFVDDQLVAYIDLIQISDTWIVGAVKSGDDYDSARPVDALYFMILSAAAADPICQHVVNGGGEEREGLLRYKQQFLFERVEIPYYTRSLLPLNFFKSIWRWLR